VAFASDAPNLVPGDTNNDFDIFVHDRQTGQTTRISVGPGGVQGNGRSFSPALSADGRFVAFESEASNLVPGDTNGVHDEFVCELQTGQITRVSVGFAGVQSIGDSSSPPSISADGRYVSFLSMATNLVPGDSSPAADAFVYDRWTALTTRVNVNSDEWQLDGITSYQAMSADGRFIAFSSNATNAVPGDTNGRFDVFVRDQLLGETTRINLTPGGNQSQGDASPLGLAISADGRFIAFDSVASDLVSGDTNGYEDVFLYDRLTGQTQRASVSSSGAQAISWSDLPALSGDGHWLMFTSSATNLVAGDTNAKRDCFVRDLVSGTTTRVSLGYAGECNGHARGCSLSWNGRYVAFTSLATNVVPGPDMSVNSDDAFVRDVYGFEPPTGFCLGDGTGAACPCANFGALGHGCGNSVNASGAYLAAGGRASLASDSLVLAGTEMPNGPCLFVQGTAQLGAGLILVFGDGLVCLTGIVTRLGVKWNAAGASQFPSGSDPTISAAGLVTTPGARTYYQIWYRDAGAFCTPFPFNLTSAIAVTWEP
jgi:Tol biopolymer transport system component